MTNNINETLKNNLKKEKEYMILSRSNTISEKNLEKILVALAEEFNKPVEVQQSSNIQSSNEMNDSGKTPNKKSNNFNSEQMKVVLSIHFQQGATARSCDSNTIVNFYGTEFKLSRIRCVLKNTGFKHCERKIARTIGTFAQEVCEILEIPGNLFNKVSRLHPGQNFTMSEKAWLSDFQSDNLSCPSHLRTFIVESFKTKKTKNSKFSHRTGK